MGLVGEIFAKAGVKIDNASFAEYSAKLKEADSQIESFSSASKGVIAGALTIPAVALGSIAAYGTQIASSYEDANLTLKTLYGSQEVAAEKMKWIQNFAATTPFEFPELVEAATQLKAYGMDIENYGRTIGDTAAAMGKPIDMAVQALADAQQGEFERMKEFGVKAVEITKKNYEQLGASAEQAGQTALTYMDKNGKQQIAVVDRNNKEMVTSTIQAIWNERYAGAMEERSKSFSGMVSSIKDNISAGLADLAGFDMVSMTVETNSLLGVLIGLAGAALSVTGAFSTMSEPMQTVLLVAALGAAGIGLLAAGFMTYSAILPLVTANTAIFGVTLSAALWPATLIVGTLALVAGGLVLLEEKTGLVSAAWSFLKDVFTIVLDYLTNKFWAFYNSLVYICTSIQTTVSNMIPDSVATLIGGVTDRISGYFGGMATDVNTRANQIRGSTENAAGGVGVLDTAMQSGSGVAQNYASNLGNILSSGSGAGSAVAGVTPSVNTATGAMQTGTTAANGYAYAFQNISRDATAAGNAAVSAASRIGAAFTNVSGQVGGIASLAGKWNTRAKLGKTSSGDAGTGEGNVKIKDPHGLYKASNASQMSDTEARVRAENKYIRSQNIKINTVNNNSNSISKPKIIRSTGA